MKSDDLLQRIRVVLVETSHPGNIGAAARAMKTMGLTKLSLVKPQNYPSAEATARASGADDVLAQAQVHDTLEEAIADCICVIGSSARSRRLEWSGLTPPESAQRLLEQAARGEVALVFGRERTGLSNEELACCQQLVTIDANPAYSSLNLAAAVQVFCYEIRRCWSDLTEGSAAQPSLQDDEQAANSGQMEGLFEHFEAALTDIGIAQPDQPKVTLMLRLRRLFFRAGMSVTEVNILRGILSAAQGRKQKR